MSGLGVRVGEEMAVSRYAGWDFHALCLAGGAVLAADGQGLCRLGGDTDDGRPIAAALDMPPVTPDADAPVRVRDIRVRGRLEDGLCATLSVDGGPPRRIPLAAVADGSEGRFPVGRDGQGRVWRLGIEDRDGRGFAITAAALRHAALDRR